MLPFSHFELCHHRYTRPNEGGPVYSGSTWGYVNANPENPARKVTVWETNNNSYIVTVFLPISLSEKDIIQLFFPTRKKLPNHVQILEVMPDSGPDGEPTEQSVKIFDTQHCYHVLNSISGLHKPASAIDLLAKMTVRYNISV